MNQELLDRLQKADQATWEKIARGIPLKPCGQYFTYVEGKPSVHQFKDAYIPFGELMPEVALAWLQACLQAAIRARGWHLYQIRNDDLPGLPCFADIIILGHGKEHDIHHEGEGDTEAEALLRAYLAAIQEAE